MTGRDADQTQARNRTDAGSDGRGIGHMKTIRTIGIIFTLLMLAGLFLFLGGMRKNGERKNNIVEYNDRLHEIGDAYLAGTDLRTLEETFGCEVILTQDPEDPRVMSLIGKRALIFDFAPEGQLIGKVAWTETDEAMTEMRDQTLRFGIILWAVVLVAGFLILFLVYRSLLRPVEEMRGFSEEIAKGNLDIPLPIHKNNLFGNLTESFDIMREELKAAKEREVQAEKAKKEMVAELSHDIKTPVATVKSACEVLKVKHGRKLEELEDAASIADEKDILEKTDLIFSKVDMIDHLITDIFHTTLEELDHLELKVKEESSLLIQDYFRNMRMYKDTFKKDIAEEKNITLENDIPECLIFMDRLRMEQVLDNIVGNSVKYAGTEIRVSFEETEGAVREDGRKDKYVRIRIRDFGPGIPEDELPLATEKYYRGQNAKEQSGYGIGLFLVKNYMEKQGGGMEYYNDDGFVVDLYVKKA